MTVNGGPEAARWDRLLVFGAVVFVLISRLAMVPRFLYDWDAVEFADALHGFDVTAGRPHPPGFLWFVLCGRVAYVLVGDERLALALVSVIASALTVPLAYRLGRRWCGADTARIWVVWWATQPLFWHYGSLQLTYCCEAAAVLALLLLWDNHPTDDGGRTRAAPFLAGLAFGLAGGFRLSTLGILGLVFLAWLGRRTWLERVVALAGVAVGVGLWLAPSAWLSGGWDAYRQAWRATGAIFFSSQSALGGNWSGSLKHLEALGAALWHALGWLLLPVMVAAGVAGVTWRRRDHGERTLALWAGAGLAWCVFFHMGQPGYLLAFLPALGLAAIRALQAAAGRSARATVALAVLLAGSNVATRALGTGPCSLATLARSQELLARQIETVRRDYQPQDTLILSYGAFRQLAWYLPEYRHAILTVLFRDPATAPLEVQAVHFSQHRTMTPERWWMPGERRPEPIDLAGVRHLLVPDEAMVWLYGGGPRLHAVPHGHPYLWVAEVPRDSRIDFGYGYWRVVTP